MIPDHPRITGIAKLKSRRQPFRVAFSDGVSCDMDLEVLMFSRWSVDLEVAPGERDRLARMSRLKVAKNLATEGLGRRVMSEREIRQKLRAKKVDPDIIDATVTDLQRVGLIDDRDFAERYCREQLHRGPVGPFKLQRDLLQRGIPRDVIDDTMRQVYADNDQRDLAAGLLRRRGFGLELRDDAKRQQRAYGLLMRRGFDNDVIQDAMQQLASSTET